jgi:hypothetical protein
MIPLDPLASAAAGSASTAAGGAAAGGVSAAVGGTSDAPSGAAMDDSLGVAFAGTCDLAIWCKLHRDNGWSGPRIARAIGRSEGYVNNLIRVADRASPAVMARWRAEQGATVRVCATDWLVAVCLLSHDRQDEQLRLRLESLEA